VALHEDRPYVLDRKGHWSLITPTGLAPGAPFDPNPDEGRLVSLPDFEVRFDSDGLRVEQEGERVALVRSWPDYVFKLGPDRIAVFGWPSQILIFEVGTFPSRVTKVCGTVTSEEKRVGPTELRLGERHVAADAKGRFELWTRETDGIVVRLDEAGLSCPNGTHVELSAEAELPVFQQRSIVMKAAVACEEDGGC